MDKTTLTDFKTSLYLVCHTTFVNTSFIFCGPFTKLFCARNNSVYDLHIFLQAVHRILFAREIIPCTTCEFFYKPYTEFFLQEKLSEILHYVRDDKAGDGLKRLGLYGLHSIQIMMAKLLSYTSLVIPNGVRDLKHRNASTQ